MLLRQPRRTAPAQSVRMLGTQQPLALPLSSAQTRVLASRMQGAMPASCGALKSARSHQLTLASQDAQLLPTLLPAPGAPHSQSYPPRSLPARTATRRVVQPSPNPHGRGCPGPLLCATDSRVLGEPAKVSPQLPAYLIQHVLAPWQFLPWR